MKKRIFALCLCFLLLLSIPAQADSSRFFRRSRYGSLISYENAQYDYALGVYGNFLMLTDTYTEALLANLREGLTEEDDEIYDLRIWYSPDYRYQFEVQVKEPTYDSFETEIAKAPEYLDLVKDGYAPESEVRQLHPGVMRETPAGTMLETALEYKQFSQDGASQRVTFVYYDIYLDDVEYCFSLYAFDGSYEAAQGMLDEIAQTIIFHPAMQI